MRHVGWILRTCNGCDSHGMSCAVFDVGGKWRCYCDNCSLRFADFKLSSCMVELLGGRSWFW